MTAVLAGLEPVDLAELTERAALLTRVDRKYVVDADDLDSLLADLPDDSRVLDIDGERQFGYVSVYLDTPGLMAFHDTAYRRRRRWKVRTRSYLATNTHFLEVKSRRGASTVKERIAWHGGLTLDLVGGRFVEESLAAAGVWTNAFALRPVLETRYRRATLLLSGSSARATVDTRLEWAGLNGGPSLSRPGLVIVETKTAGHPCALDTALWRAGHRPVSVSKYATGMAALRPDLPRNRWNRVLASQGFGCPRP